MMMAMKMVMMMLMLMVASMKMMIIFKDVIGRTFPISSRFQTRGHSSGPHVFRWVNEYDTCNRDIKKLKLRITKTMST